jgi:hypothetical protein
VDKGSQNARPIVRQSQEEGSLDHQGEVGSQAVVGILELCDASVLDEDIKEDNLRGPWKPGGGWKPAVMGCQYFLGK